MGDDEELWAQICRRDEKAFGRFYQEAAPRLRGFLRHLVSNSEAAEDIMQETFTQVWCRPNGFKPERGTLLGYLYGIGRKRASEWWRKAGRSDVVGEQSAAPDHSDILSIRDALQRLDEEQRTLLWLREVEGQSYEELAKLLGIPIGTVRSRLFTAREQLRKIWRPQS